MEEGYVYAASKTQKGCFYNVTPLPPSTGTTGAVLKPLEGFFYDAITVLAAINTVFITRCSASRLQRCRVKGQSSLAMGGREEEKADGRELQLSAVISSFGQSGLHSITVKSAGRTQGALRTNASVLLHHPGCLLVGAPQTISSSDHFSWTRKEPPYIQSISFS